MEGVCVDNVAFVTIMLDDWFLYLRESTFLFPSFPPCWSAPRVDAVVLNIDKTYQALNPRTCLAKVHVTGHIRWEQQ